MILGQKRSCSSINHLGLFCHFLLGLEYQVQSQASLLHHIVRSGPRMRPPQTQKLIKTNAPFSPTKHVY